MNSNKNGLCLTQATCHAGKNLLEENGDGKAAALNRQRGNMALVAGVIGYTQYEVVTDDKCRDLGFATSKQAASQRKC